VSEQSERVGLNDKLCTEVFAFEWCGCVYESAFSVVSLHSTRKGAFKAMTLEANRRWRDERNRNLMYGKGGHSPLCHERWRVRGIEVHNTSLTRSLLSS